MGTSTLIRNYDRPANAELVPQEGPYQRTGISGLALAAALYLMYSPVFVTDYLMNDEWQLIGSRASLTQSAKEAFLFWGRGLFGIYCTLVYRFVGYDPFRIQIIRFVNFASLVAVALLLFWFLAKRAKNVWLAFFVILFFYSTGSLQEGMAYSLQLISNMQPALWFSLAAFYVYFCVDERRFSTPLRLGAAFLLLLCAMQSTQTFAFFGMVPLTYLALSDWRRQRRKIMEFIVVAVLVLIVSTLSYKTALGYLHTHGRQGYALAEGSLDAAGQHPLAVLLHAANPFTYWSAFEIWSYPFPFHFIPPLRDWRIGIAMCLMGAWAILLLGTLLIEAREEPAHERKEVFEKWLAVLVCLGLNAVFVVADSPLVTIEHRPHMVFTFVGIAIFSATYCVQVLAAKYPALRRTPVRAAGVVFVVLIALGAQAGTLRGYVNNRMQLLNFIRTEAMAKDPSTYQNIIVVLPDTGPEPRGVWIGHAIQRRMHMTREGGYRYALATSSIPPESKNIIFVEDEPKEMPASSVVIDWRKYIAARAQDPF